MHAIIIEVRFESISRAVFGEAYHTTLLESGDPSMEPYLICRRARISLVIQRPG
jgi:hypothetical protein